MLFYDRMLPKYNVTATLQVCAVLQNLDWIEALDFVLLIR